MMRRALTAALVLAVLLCGPSAYGQWWMRVHESEGTTEFLMTDIDTIVFHDSTPQMVAVPAGVFTMGDLGSYCSDEHEVQLTRDFYLSQHEVTNQEYVEALQWAYDGGHVTVASLSVKDALDGSDRVLVWLGGLSFSEGTFSIVNPNHPAVGVTWYGAARYCDWLSLMDGLSRAYEHSGDWLCNGHNPYGAEGYRLPTDAEWEYAAQYDDERIYPWGNEPPDCSRANYILDYAGQDCVGSTSPVGSYPDAPASLGLSDMAGNVFEWCNDWHQCNLGATAEEDPVGPATGTLRSMRGGAWIRLYPLLRCAYRAGGNVINQYGYNYVGFRVARTASP